MYELNGRKALVSGGGQGLGEGIAQALARAGAAVMIGDINAQTGKATAAALRESGATGGVRRPRRSRGQQLGGRDRADDQRTGRLRHPDQ